MAKFIDLQVKYDRFYSMWIIIRMAFIKKNLKAINAI